MGLPINKLLKFKKVGSVEITDSSIREWNISIDEVFLRLREEYERAKEILISYVLKHKVELKNIDHLVRKPKTDDELIDEFIKNHSPSEIAKLLSKGKHPIRRTPIFSENLEKPKVKILGVKNDQLKEIWIRTKVKRGRDIEAYKGVYKGTSTPIEYWRAYLLTALYKKKYPDSVIFLTKAPKNERELKELLYRDINVLEMTSYWELKFKLTDKLNKIPYNEEEYKEFIKTWREEIFRLLYFRPRWIKEVQEGLLFYLLSEDEGLNREEFLALREYYMQYPKEFLTPYERKYANYITNSAKGTDYLDKLMRDLEEYDVWIEMEIDKVRVKIEEEDWIARLGLSEIEIPYWIFELVVNSLEYECPYQVLSRLTKAMYIYNLSNLSNSKLGETHTKYTLLERVI